MSKKKKASKFLKRIMLGFSMIILFIVLLVMMVAGNQTSQSQTVNNGVTYVAHWTNGDAYTHNFLHQRYGITKEQIEGFIKSQGYEPEGRSSGESFLEAQAKSGIDVRVLVAFAQMESSYGTAGVAKHYPEANIWGYGCFDNDPNQGRDWGPERAFANFRSYQIEQLGNYNLQIMDERAQQYKLGALPVGKGVYYTDTTGTGKARAAVMEAFDKYIDEHDGTPEPPLSSTPLISGGGPIAASWDFPVEYASKMKYGQPSSASLVTQPGSGYPVGQCTWYVYNRLMETGIITVGDGYGYLGNGQDWVGSLTARGWKRIDRPVAGAVVSMAYGEYGHVAFIEHVNEDGSFLLSECNYAGNQSQVHFQVTTHQANFTYAVRN